MMKSTPARGTDGQRERILDAAIAVFGERGFAAATTRLVGQRCGVNSALIYYYFENKDTLFAAALQRVVEGFLEELRARARPLQGARARLTFLVDGVLDYYTAHPDRMRLISSTLVMHPDLLGHAIRERLRRGDPLPLQVLAEGAAAGELRVRNPFQAWWSILGLCLFALHAQDVVATLGRRRVGEELASAGGRREYIIDVLLNGLSSEGA